MDTDNRKALALAAAHGRWRNVVDDHGIQFGDAGGVVLHHSMPKVRETARYIAEANPATVLALIAEVERLRADAGRYRKIRVKVAQDYLSFRKMDGERLDKVVDNVLDPAAAIEKEKA